MDPPPFPEGGQPESYTSNLLPGTGEQSNVMSDFTTAEMEPFLTLPSNTSVEEQQQSLSDTGSLRQAPVHPPQSNYSSQEQESPSNTTCSVAPMTLYSTCRPRSLQEWNTASPGEQDFSYGAASTCGSGTSNSNFSPASPAATWSSPATSFHQAPDQFSQDNSWSEHLRTLTPVSVDESLGASPSRTGNTINQGYDSDWHCESLSTVPNLDFATMSATSCPPSPADGLVSTYPPPVDSLMPAYMRQQSRSDSPIILSTADVESHRASEPPLPNTPAEASGDGPPYAQLIYKALMSRHDHCMTLQEIYQWFRENTEKPKGGGKGWQNSIRHNLSMNRGFIKRERKEAEQNGATMTPVDDDTICGDPKRSTEWTLQDWAITDGIQSTTRYRGNKGKDDSRKDKAMPRSAHHPYYHSSSHGLSSRNRVHSSRIHKIYRPTLRSAPTSHSHYMPRTPASVMLPSVYQDHYLSGSLRQPKMEPGMPSCTTSAETYPMMIPDQHGMMHSGHDNYALSNSASSGMYMGNPQQGHEFPYTTADVQLGYPGDGTATDGGRRLEFDPNMSHSLYTWNNGQGY